MAKSAFGNTNLNRPSPGGMKPPPPGYMKPDSGIPGGAHPGTTPGLGGRMVGYAAKPVSKNTLKPSSNLPKGAAPGGMAC